MVGLLGVNHGFASLKLWFLGAKLPFQVSFFIAHILVSRHNALIDNGIEWHMILGLICGHGYVR